MIDDIHPPLTLNEGDVSRVWIVDWPGEALAFVSSGSEAEFPSRATAAGQTLATIDWDPWAELPARRGAARRLREGGALAGGQWLARQAARPNAATADLQPQHEIRG